MQDWVFRLGCRGLQSAEFEMPKIWAHDFFLETHILLLFI